MIAHEPSCRLRAIREEGFVRVVTRNVSFGAEGQLGLDDQSLHPSSLDLLVAALAADLLAGLEREATRNGTPLHEAELRLAARLENPLVALGVVGEEGGAGLAEITGTLALSIEGGAAVAGSLWRRTLEKAPVFVTLQRAVALRIDLEVIP